MLKKFKGDAESKAAHYRGREPEYATMSLKPSIDKEWFEKFGTETYLHDSVIMRGKEMKPPRYYDILFEIEEPVSLKEIKRLRKRGIDADEQEWDTCP